mgnify:CR=1 FL=1
MEEQKREKASNSQKDKTPTILFIKNIICDIIHWGQSQYVLIQADELAYMVKAEAEDERIRLEEEEAQQKAIEE